MSVISNNTLAGSSGQGGAAGYEIQRSLRFNSGDSSHLSKTFASAGNRKTWTWSGWLKRSKLGVYQVLWSAGPGNYANLYLLPGDGLYLEQYTSSTDYRAQTAAVFRDASAWYHVVLAFDSTQSTSTDRIKIYINGQVQTITGSPIYPSQDYASGLFNSTDAHSIGRNQPGGSMYLDGYLADIHFIDGQALAASDFGAYDTNNVWQPIEYAGTYGTNGFKLDFSDTSSNAALGTDSSNNSNTWTVNNLVVSNLGATTNSSVSASNTHVVTDVMATVTGTYDFSNAFDGDASTIGYMGQVIFHNEGSYSKPTVANSSGGVEVKAAGNGITATINGGSQVSCTSGAFTKISGTFDGTLDSINVYNNTSGASYFYAVKVNGVEIAVRKKGDAGNIDSLVDSPTNGDSANDTGAGGEVVGNYCTFNPLSTNSIGTAQFTYSDGNLVVNNVTNAYGYVTGTIYASSGKWYAEFVPGANLDATYDYIGITALNSNRNYPGAVTNGFWYAGSGNKVNSGYQGSSYGATYATGDVIGVALDLDNYTVTFYKNGVSQGVAFTGLDSSTSWTFSTGDYGNSQTVVNYTANFGQRAFAYTAPSGYKCLCTANLPDPTIADGSTAFDTKLYTGNGGTQAIGNLNFSPDLIWIKTRSGSGDHHLFDVVRGVNKSLHSNSSSATETTTAGLTAFNSNGFSIGNSNNDINGNGTTFASWNWDAGASTVSNTDGSITSSVRANQTAGFSIISYTGNGTAGSTIGHGLNAAPKFVICKRRDSAQGWRVGHVSPGWAQGAYLHLTDAFASLSGFWNNTAPTSSVITLGTYPNTNTGTYICLAFAPVEGYSAFGSYVGNGSSSGPFIYTGFKTRWVMMKKSTNAGSWVMYDTERDTVSSGEGWLYANSNSSEQPATTYAVHTTSNGFRMAGTSGENNGNGETYIYLAFAEHPFKTARAT